VAQHLTSKTCAQSEHPLTNEAARAGTISGIAANGLTQKNSFRALSRGALGRDGTNGFFWPPTAKWLRKNFMQCPPRMKVYHRTLHSAAILREGFRDSTGTYMTDQEFTGVWVSDCPLDINEGGRGDVVLTLDVPIDVFERYEWIEEGKPYRESLIPASVLNALATPRIVLR